MSSNNVVWVMSYKGYLHVFYSGCIDNEPTEPDIDDEYYKMFGDRSKALTYAHDVVKKINKESYAEGFAGVEYGVCELDYPDESNRINSQLDTIDCMIDEWKRKIKDLEFSIDQFEQWRKELLRAE